VGEVKVIWIADNFATNRLLLDGRQAIVTNLLHLSVNMIQNRMNNMTANLENDNKKILQPAISSPKKFMKFALGIGKRFLD